MTMQKDEARSPVFKLIREFAENHSAFQILLKTERDKERFGVAYNNT